MPRMQAAWDIFQQNPVFGVGIGVYNYYMDASDINDVAYTKGVPWISIRSGQPAVNIYLELLVTTGIVGALPFFAFLLSFLFWGRGKPPDLIDKSYLIAIITFFIMLAIESNYLRLYFWMLLGIYLGSLGAPAEKKRAAE